MDVVADAVAEVLIIDVTVVAMLDEAADPSRSSVFHYKNRVRQVNINAETSATDIRNTVAWNCNADMMLIGAGKAIPLELIGDEDDESILVATAEEDVDVDEDNVEDGTNEGVEVVNTATTDTEDALADEMRSIPDVEAGTVV